MPKWAQEDVDKLFIYPDMTAIQQELSNRKSRAAVRKKKKRVWEKIRRAAEADQSRPEIVQPDGPSNPEESDEGVQGPGREPCAWYAPQDGGDHGAAGAPSTSYSQVVGEGLPQCSSRWFNEYAALGPEVEVAAGPMDFSMAGNFDMLSIDQVTPTPNVGHLNPPTQLSDTTPDMTTIGSSLWGPEWSMTSTGAIEMVPAGMGFENAACSDEGPSYDFAGLDCQCGTLQRYFAQQFPQGG